MASIAKRTISWTTKEKRDSATGEVLEPARAKTAVKYEAMYRDRAGKRHRKLFRLRKDAQAWLDEQTAGLVTGQWASPALGKQTFKAFAEEWRARQVLAESTEALYEVALRSCYEDIGGMALATIAPADIQRLVKRWSTSWAPKTVQNRYGVLSIAFRAAVREKRIPESPCQSIRLPKVAPRAALVPITTEVVLAMRDEIADRYKAFVTVAAGTGMRRGELLGLTHDRVSQKFGTILVDRQLRSGGDRPTWKSLKTEASHRTIPVADVVLEAIEHQRKTYGTGPEGLVFSTEIGTPVSTSAIQRVWTLAAKKVGTEATPHDCRHYFASMHIAAGTSIKALQALLGHKNATETWDTYGHLVGDEDSRSRAVIQDALGNRDHSTTTGGAQVT